MSRTIKKGFNDWLDRWEKQYRAWDHDDYPITFHGHVFDSPDDYIAWYRRQWVSGKHTSDVGSPHSGSPKGYDSWEEQSTQHRRRDAKTATARQNRRCRDKKIIRESIGEE
jgi:hypothetical protein